MREFNLDVSGFSCADFGCNVGGFTDCLLKRGAAHVYAVDTGYGTLAYTLRIDDRVTVMERTNALHVVPPAAVDLVTIDLAWTPQRHAIPAALRWLRSDGEPIIISLVKPHYELTDDEKRAMLVDGVLDAQEAERVLHRVLDAMPSWGAAPVRWSRSPITGGKSGRKAGRSGTKRLPPGVIGRGNVEYLVLGRPAARED